MCTRNVYDEKSLNEFVEELIEELNIQHTVNSPTTSMLCISMIGSVNANKIASLITEQAATNEIFGFYLSRMSAADVVHGTKTGELIETVSLA